jgi:hypothetical protein
MICSGRMYNRQVVCAVGNPSPRQLSESFLRKLSTHVGDVALLGWSHA